MNISKSKIKKNQSQAGMSYVEVIVVLSIFSVVSGVAMFNYKDFQDRVDIKNLASDVALKIVEAQKSALSGTVPAVEVPATWKPSYGVYLDINPISQNASFIYFVDLDELGFFDGTDCTGECLNKVSITKNNFIQGLAVYYQDGTSTVLEDLTITFSRLGSGATIVSGSTFYDTADYAEIAVQSPKGATAFIKIYRSGRIEID